MFKKAVFLAVLIMALSFGSAFAFQIDSVVSSTGDVPPTQLFVNPGGLGDVLLYGYYNVRSQDQFFTITNTSAVSGARVRIRFREAATIASQCNGSQEVLDFDICLSKGDMWTGHIFTGPDGAGWLKSPDTDTYVQTSGSAAVAANVTGTRVIFSEQYPDGVAFKYGENNTVTDITADNTREGYFEVIAERGLDENCSGSSCTCGNLRDVQGQQVDNVLMGHTYMVNLGTMETYGYVATAIADFTVLDITRGIQSGAPDLRDSDDAAIAVRPIDPVNYALTKLSLEGIYDLESQFGGHTAWIVTFPTKWATHDEDGAGSAATCTDTVADIFDDTSVLITIWDDQENQDTPSECEFSPCPDVPGNSLPNEVNVINIQNSSIFTSDVTRTLQFRTVSFDFGWIDINMLLGGAGLGGLTDPIHATSFGGQVTFGLPAIGYQAMKFNGGKATGMLPLQYKSLAFTPPPTP
jgi:hypothetical protein